MDIPLNFNREQIFYVVNRPGFAFFKEKSVLLLTSLLMLPVGIPTVSPFVDSL